MLTKLIEAISRLFSGGTGVLVGGIGVLVGGIGVLVGGTDVFVDVGTGVFVGTGVSVGGTGVLVGGTGVLVAVGTGVSVGSSTICCWSEIVSAVGAAVTRASTTELQFTGAVLVTSAYRHLVANALI